MSPFWILLEVRVMEVVVTTGVIRCAKLESKMSPPTNQHPVFTGWMPFLSPNCVKKLKLMTTKQIMIINDKNDKKTIKNEILDDNTHIAR